MRTLKTSILWGLLGVFVGIILIAVDGYIDRSPDVESREKEILEIGFEGIEFLLMGPGLGLLCFFASELLRLMQKSHAHLLEQERQQRMLVLGKLAAAVAHEVRNPLHSLRLIMDEMLVDHPELAVSPLAKDFSTSVDRIDRAVELVYRLARPSYEDHSYADLTAIVTAVCAQRAAVMPAPAFHLADIPSQASIACAASAATIAVENILRNAQEAAPPDSIITVCVRAQPGGWEFKVTNTGRIPPELELAVHVERDFSTPSGNVDLNGHQSGGLGLGLLITRHLISTVGGTLTLTNVGDNQVEACVVLPQYTKKVSGEMP